METQKKELMKEIKILFYLHNKNGYYPLSEIVELSSDFDDDGDEITEIANIIYFGLDEKLHCTDSSFGKEASVRIEDLKDEILKDILSAMRHTIEDKSKRPAVTRRWLENIVKEYELHSGLV